MRLEPTAYFSLCMIHCFVSVKSQFLHCSFLISYVTLSRRLNFFTLSFLMYVYFGMEILSVSYH